MNKKNLVALLFLGITATLSTVTGATVKMAMAQGNADKGAITIANEEEDGTVAGTTNEQNAKHMGLA
jgi:uncharacterized protein (UPF0333 family)